MIKAQSQSAWSNLRCNTSITTQFGDWLIQQMTGRRWSQDWAKHFVHLLQLLMQLAFIHDAGGKDVNTLRPRQNGRHFADAIFKCIFLNENIWILIKISLKFVPKSSINNIPALVQIMAWRRPGDKPLSEPMVVNLPTHICVTRPQWVKLTHWSMDIQCSAVVTWSIFSNSLTTDTPKLAR